jgi:hypothetical protein
MAVAFVRDHVTEFAKVAGTTDAYALTAAVPAGNLLVAVTVFDNAATASKPVISSISRAAGETNNWVFLGAARSTSISAGAFASGEMWAIRTTVAWPNATSLTFTYDTSITMKAQDIIEFSGADAILRSTSGTAYSTTTTAASAATTGTTPTIGDLALGFLFGSNVAAAQAGDTDTLGGSWSTPFGVGSTGGSAATNNYGITQYKILTAASQQTYNSSAAPTAGNGAIVAILQATPVVTQAAYRLYADGTETGSVALAAQDTPPTVDISSGDARLGLRVLLQSTGITVASTDDFQLQWEKNASGIWTNVVPPIPTAGLASWYDAADASTFAYSSGSLVSQWRDKSGLGRHLGQTNPLAQPQRVGTQNGRTPVLFDGVDDYMDSIAPFTVPQPITLFVAFSPAHNPQNAQGVFSSLGGEWQTWIGNTEISYYAGTVQTIGQTIFGLQRLSLVFNGASSRAYRDGVLMNTSDVGTFGTTTGWRITERRLASGYFPNGPYFEIIIYSRVLSDPERQQVEEYLKTKWGMP